VLKVLEFFMLVRAKP